MHTLYGNAAEGILPRNSLTKKLQTFECWNTTIASHLQTTDILAERSSMQWIRHQEAYCIKFSSVYDHKQTQSYKQKPDITK